MLQQKPRKIQWWRNTLEMDPSKVQNEVKSRVCSLQKVFVWNADFVNVELIVKQSPSMPHRLKLHYFVCTTAQPWFGRTHAAKQLWGYFSCHTSSTIRERRSWRMEMFPQCIGQGSATLNTQRAFGSKPFWHHESSWRETLHALLFTFMLCLHMDLPT